MARTWATRGLIALLLASVFFLSLLAIPSSPVAPPAKAGPGSTPVTGEITGPPIVGLGLRSSYHVFARGGPATALNGTVVGVYSYKASLVGLNTSTGTLSPPEGVLVNGSMTLDLIAPNLTESITIYVDVTSSFAGDNATTNLTYAVNIVRPISLGATLNVGGPAGVKAFSLAVHLDGATVGSISIPGLTSGQTYPITFSYVSQGLSAGWHTFTVSLAEEHGLVTFVGGSQTLSVSFYIPGGGTDYSLWVLAGAVAFVGAVFIWVTRVGGRRRAKGKS